MKYDIIKNKLSMFYNIISIMLFGGNMSSNISKQKRERMMQFLSKLKEEHKNDDSMLIALGEIEAELNAKKYGLVWEEHEEAVDVMMKDNIPVFTECIDKEIHASDSDSYNFLLEGDNLHSLHLLEKTHKGRLGCIYIDPPYNRGKDDFIYNDNFVALEDGYRHSKWLSFMSRRLKLANSLLRDDGLILISIDDYEYAQLKILCDDIFGENNFINMFIWQRNSSGKTEKEKFTVNTEYVMLYSKSQNYSLNEAYKPLSDGTKAMYSKNDNDGRGNYRLYPLQKPGNPGPETTYDYVDNNGKVWPCPAKGWRIKQSKLKALENDGRLYLEGKSLSEKAYWNERTSEGKRIDTLWNDLPENSSASKEIEQIFDKKGMFNNPKPTDLIKRCIKIAPNDSIVLDFFAGSGTTAQAVLELNKEDGGNRKFILCTNNENSICENITYQGIKTVITGKREDGSDYSDGIPTNLKYYRTDFVSKNEEYLSDALLEHVAEMIQLEHGIKLDGKRYITVMNDDEADRLAEHWNEYPDVKALYVSKNVLFTTKQNTLFKDVDIHIIPDYYFNFELREVGETW